MRVTLLLLLVFLGFGCRQDAQSQHAQERPPQRAEPQAGAPALQEEIVRSRRTAITRAVEVASPAVVSVNVIQVRRVRYGDPFADFFNDPFYHYFFGRSRTREQQVQSLGSGFVISPDGYVVTNDHVAGSATQTTVSFPDGRTMEAELVGSDPASDIALLKVDPEEPLPYLAFDTSGPPLVGEWVIAMGNPFGLFEAADPTVTVGVVSAVGRDLQGGRSRGIYRDMIQTDASINRGNSGGPLLNAAGEVIGVNAAIISETGGSVGIGFAVPAAKARRIIEELKEHGRVDRSYYTGLSIRDLDARLARALGLETLDGVFVRGVEPGSPAERAGFQPYDVIVAMEDEAVSDGEDLRARLFDFRPGDAVGFEVLRDGAVLPLTMQIGRLDG